MTADPAPEPANSEYLRRPDAQGHLKVLEVLRKWDPIGVFDIPGSPRDEYDSYAPTLIRMLDAGATRDEIVRWMRRVATRYMGLGEFDPKLAVALAQELIDFWHEWKGV